MWANENWTRRWDGHEHEILIEQTYDPDYEIGLSTIFNVTSRILATCARHSAVAVAVPARHDSGPSSSRRALARNLESRHGEEPIIFSADAFGNYDDPRLFGLDGAFEFPPHKLLDDIERSMRS